MGRRRGREKAQPSSAQLRPTKSKIELLATLSLNSISLYQFLSKYMVFINRNPWILPSELFTLRKYIPLLLFGPVRGRLGVGVGKFSQGYGTPSSSSFSLPLLLTFFFPFSFRFPITIHFPPLPHPSIPLPQTIQPPSSFSPLTHLLSHRRPLPPFTSSLVETSAVGTGTGTGTYRKSCAQDAVRPRAERGLAAPLLRRGPG